MRPSPAAYAALIASGAVFLSWRLFASGELHAAPPTTELEATPEDQAAPSGPDRAIADGSAVQQEMRGLRARMAELEQQLALSQERPRDEGERPSPAEEEAELQRYEGWLVSRSASEPLDGAWTDDVAGHVVTALSRDASLQHDVAIDSVRCSTSMCVIQITHSEPDSHARVHQGLDPESPVGEALVRRHALSDGRYQSFFFYSRVSASLPQRVVGLE